MGRHEDEERDSEAAPSVEPPTVGTLEPFIHQVGGHVGLLSWNSSTVCKPYTLREKHFYEALPNCIEKFAAKYLGVMEVLFEEDESGYLSLVARSALTDQSSQGYARIEQSQTAKSKYRFRMKRSGSLELESCSTEEHLFKDVSSNTYGQNPWAIKCQTRHVAKMRSYQKHRFVLLENLVRSLRFPSVLDVKMGIQQHGDDAPEQKIRVQTAKCERSTSAKLGVRLVGMQVYDARLGLYHCVNKYHGRELSEDGLKEHLAHFVHAAAQSARLHLCRAFVRRLQTLLETLSRSEGYRFFSSSLLLMYDGADDGASSADVRMIDFEHSTFPGFLDDPRHSGADQGFCMGLRTLISMFNELLQTSNV